MPRLSRIVKDAIKGAFRRYNREPALYAGPRFQTPRVLERIVEGMALKNPEIRFLQVGANDGIRADPIRNIVLERQLRGVLVEPLPDMFQSLVANYAGQPNLVFENVAIGEAEGQQTIYRLPASADVPDLYHGSASFFKPTLEKMMRKMRCTAPILEEVVPMTTMKRLVDKHGLKDAELLLVDCEGYDAKIVFGAFDAGMAPEVVCYEYMHLTPDEIDGCASMLLGRGYKLCHIGIDTIAIRE